MPTLEAVCAQIQTYMLALPGVKAAPALAPDNITQYPFSVCHPVSGVWAIESYPLKRGLHKVALDLHVAFKDTPTDFKTLFPFVEAVPNLLFKKLLDDNKWNGLIETFDSVDYAFVSLIYGGTQTHGIQFVINGVKMRSSIE